MLKRALRHNKALHLAGAAAVVLRDITSLQAALASEVYRYLGKEATFWEEQSCRYPSSCST
jgi:hypothetical protein